MKTLRFGARIATFVAALVLAACAVKAARADVVDFEGGLDPRFVYTSVDVLDGTLLPADSGYRKMANLTPGTMVAFNPFAASPAIFKWADPSSLFNLDSLLIAGAWGTQTVTFTGYRGGALLHTDSLFIGPDVQAFSPEWQGLDEFRVAIGDDFVDTVDGGTGQHFALDNLVVETCDIPSAVPEPTSMALLATGALGLLRRRFVSSA